MSKFSLVKINLPLSVQTLKRLPQIKAGLLTGLNYEQIGKKCGVTEKTIDRDIGKWLQSGQFETWIKEEWLRLHNIIIHEDPTEAYRQITKLLSRMVTRKMEVKEEITERLEAKIILEVTEDEDSILNKAASILDKRLSEKNKPNKIH